MSVIKCLFYRFYLLLNDNYFVNCFDVKLILYLFYLAIAILLIFSTTAHVDEFKSLL